jgi:sarcosine oxidase subunit beta
METIGTDVVIVGGGLMGCSAALELSRKGRSVVVLDRGFVGAQASGVNFGLLRRQDRFLPQLPLANRSHGIWRNLERLIGDDCEFRATGHLRIAFDDEDMTVIEDYAAGAREYGFDIELMGRDRLHRRWPFLGDRVMGAGWSPDDGVANPRVVTPAYARAARAAGADIREQHEVVEVEHDGGGFRVATLGGIEVRAPVMLNTAGAWAHRISECFGEPVPLTAIASPEIVTEPLPFFIEPAVQRVGSPVVLRQDPRGNVIIGGKPRGVADNVNNRTSVAPESTLANMRKAIEVVPSLRSVNLIRVWSGIEAALPDNLPVIGPSLTTPGLYHAFGFSGHGFQVGPAVGVVLSELVMDGRTDTPIEPFTMGRFADYKGEGGAA